MSKRPTPEQRASAEVTPDDEVEAEATPPTGGAGDAPEASETSPAVAKDDDLDATDALMAASQSFTQKLYEAASQEGTAGGGSGAGTAGAADQPSDDDVVDAEIVDDEEGSSS